MNWESARAVVEKVNTHDNVTIVCATKTVPSEVMNGIYDELGLGIVGENRVQELLSKYEDANRCKSWHFIGQLQTNKVKYIIDKVDLIQSVDRLNLAVEIDRQAKKIAKTQDILVEVNMADEVTKGGATPDEVFAFIDEIQKLDNIRVKGLMSVLPNLEDKVLLGKYYKKLFNLYDEIKRAKTGIEYLSAGMSGDWEIAVDNGANMIRLGSILFGKRVY